MNILSVRNLKKYYNTGENTVKALDGIDLDICKGEFLAVVGTSGSNCLSKKKNRFCISKL